VNILVVDPDADNRDSWTLFLRCLGHQVSTATDTTSALLQSQTFRPDVVLTELVLPDVDGCQLARRLREREGGHRLLLVALTWDSQLEERARSERVGFDYVLAKPAEPKAVLAILEAAGRTTHQS
jgi:CheY-like chemotaxis protein